MSGTSSVKAGPARHQGLQQRSAKAAPQATPKAAKTAQDVEPSSPAHEDVLEIAGHVFHNVRPLAKGLSIKDAAKVTDDDGFDQLYVEDSKGQAYIAYTRAGLHGIRKGFLGRLDGQKVKVVVADEEANTFLDGVRSVWNWLSSTIAGSGSSQLTTVVTATASTLVGGLLATGAAKSGATSAMAAVKADSIEEAAKVGRAAIGGAFESVLEVAIPLAAVGVAALGGAMLIKGTVAAMRKPDMAPIGMVTGDY